MIIIIIIIIITYLCGATGAKGCAMHVERELVHKGWMRCQPA